jgi:hypothetical protein
LFPSGKAKRTVKGKKTQKKKPAGAAVIKRKV